MGFGTLFIGYFLVLNIFNYAYTDLIAALIMMFASYKLSAVSVDFKKAFYSLTPFAVICTYEIFAELLGIFTNALANPILTGTIGIARWLILGCASYLFLTGIKGLAKEVDLPRLYDKAKSSRVSLIFAYSVAIILEIPYLDRIMPTKAIAVIALLSLIFTFAATLYALTAIYSAYMRICMPEDLVREERKSKLGAVNKFRENEKKRGEEYASYKIEKFKNQNKKKGRK